MPGDRDDYGDILRRAFEAALAQAPEPRPERELDAICDDLLSRPPGQQRILAGNSRRVGSIEVCWRLVARSEALRHEEPAAMLEVAGAALRVASALPEASPSVSLVADARAEAWASLANARRVTGDLVAAEEAWREADTFLAEGTGEPLLEARFCALKGSLRLAQRRTAEAIRLFRSACRLYRRVGDPHLAARTLISLGQAYEQAGRLGAAIRAACQGGRQLDPGREPELRLAAVHNLIHYLGEAGYPREALSLLREAAPLYRIHGGQMIALRMRWVESRLSRSLGNEVEALAELEEVRREFAARGMAFDAAQVALELAAAHAAAGRHEEVERLASELYPVFLSRGIPDEALVTLSLFLQAVERREATAEWVSGLALRLAELGPPHLR